MSEFGVREQLLRLHVLASVTSTEDGALGPHRGGSWQLEPGRVSAGGGLSKVSSHTG